VLVVQYRKQEKYTWLPSMLLLPPPPPPSANMTVMATFLLSLSLSLSPLNVAEVTGLLVLACRGIGACISLQGDRRLNQIQMITKNGCILYLFFFRGTVDCLCLDGGRPAVWLTPYKLLSL
jgi:hypothetical protein